MNTDRIIELEARIAGHVAELLSIGFPANVPLETEQDIDRSNAQQAIISNRLNKLKIAIDTAQHELALLKSEGAAVFPADAALLNIVAHLTPSSTKATKLRVAAESYTAWRELVERTATGEL